jgi:hypothetical protein
MTKNQKDNQNRKDGGFRSPVSGVLSEKESIFQEYFDEYISDSPLTEEKKAAFMKFLPKLEEKSGFNTLRKNSKVVDRYISRKGTLIARYSDIELEYSTLSCRYEICDDENARRILKNRLNSLIKLACTIFLELEVITKKLKKYYRYMAIKTREYNEKNPVVY